MNYEIMMPQTLPIVITDVKKMSQNEHGQTILYGQDGILAVAPKEAAVYLVGEPVKSIKVSCGSIEFNKSSAAKW